MKKIVISSIVINLLLLCSIAVVLNKYSNVKNDYNVSKKDTIAIEKNKSMDSVIDKNDPIYIFKSQKFPCDSGYTSYEINLCTREQLHFADSLLNLLVKTKLKQFDYLIAQDKAGLSTKSKGYFVKSLKNNIASKDNFIKAQKKWEELRKLNSDYIGLGCEGGTGCVGIVNDAEIKEVLKRMQEIKERYN